MTDMGWMEDEVQASQLDFYSCKVLTMAQEGEDDVGHMAEDFKTLAFVFLTKWNGKVQPGSDDLHAEVSDL